MSVKRKNMNLYSWEEEAFAEDGRGPLGGFVWPPRSYSCGFCKREFRSAQALGGHMNVHRREKAKLKQTSPHNNNDQETLCRAANLFPSKPALCQDSSSDTNKSCVYDEELVVVHGNDGDTDQTDLVLGFDMNSSANMGGKRRKTSEHSVSPAIMSGELDLELRLSNY